MVDVPYKLLLQPLLSVSEQVLNDLDQTKGCRYAETKTTKAVALQWARIFCCIMGSLNTKKPSIFPDILETDVRLIETCERGSRTKREASCDFDVFSSLSFSEQTEIFRAVSVQKIIHISFGKLLNG